MVRITIVKRTIKIAVIRSADVVRVEVLVEVSVETIEMPLWAFLSL